VAKKVLGPMVVGTNERFPALRGFYPTFLGRGGHTLFWRGKPPKLGCYTLPSQEGVCPLGIFSLKTRGGSFFGCTNFPDFQRGGF